MDSCADFHTESDDVRRLCVMRMKKGHGQTHERPVRPPSPSASDTPHSTCAGAQPYGLIVNYDNFRSEPIEQIVDAHRYMETNTQRGKIVVAT